MPVRTLFRGRFESFLARRSLTVHRYEPVRCTNADCGQLLERSVVRKRMNEGKNFAFCDECGEKLSLPKIAESVRLTRDMQTEVDDQRRAAEQRTRFEQAIFRVQAYITEQGIQPPDCFISYAWGVLEQERWVEKRLATDLQKAGSRWCWTAGTTPKLARAYLGSSSALRNAIACSSWERRFTGRPTHPAVADLRESLRGPEML